MSVFGESYSNLYHLIYKDKNYREEVNFVDKYLQNFKPGASTILDLGCGTGEHARIFTERGYQVLGVDRSEAMLSIAKKCEIPGRLRFILQDLLTLDVDESFDAIVSLFHVLCYIDKNEDMQKVFNNISRHLNRGGVLIFDCWYGPAVLNNLPSVRLKEIEDDAVKVIRITEPVLFPNENVVDVHFKILIKDNQTCYVKEIQEIHRIRYLFIPEIKEMLSKAGIKLEKSIEFLTGKNPDLETWNVCFVGRKL